MKTKKILPENNEPLAKRPRKTQKELSEQLDEFFSKCDFPPALEYFIKESHSSFDLETWKVCRHSNYTQAMKDFTLCLHYNSLSAFKLFNRLFKLPPKDQLIVWQSNEKYLPGFLEQSFAYLEQEISSKRMKSECSLIVGSMELTQKLAFAEDLGCYLGEVDWGGIPTGESGILASQALVFFLVSNSSHIKIPIGYFLASVVTPILLAELIKSFLLKLNSVGVTIVSLTYGGCENWIQVFKILGCYFESGIMTSFTIPSNECDIFVFIDVFYLLNKCIDILAKYGKINSNKGCVEFKFIERLVNRIREIKNGEILDVMQKSYFHRISIKVKSQLISKDISDALSYLHYNKDPLYIGSEGTVEFIRSLSMFSDFFNYKFESEKDKTEPLARTNVQNLLKKLDSVFQYLTFLKIGETRMLTHHEKGCVLGLLFNIASLRSVVENHYTKHLRFFSIHQLSFRPLEWFFTLITHNNPTPSVNCAQFRFLLKRYLSDIGVEKERIAGPLSPPISISWFPWDRRSMFDTSDLTDNRILRLRYLINSNNLIGIHDLSSHRLCCLIELLISELNCAECCDILISNLSVNASEIESDQPNQFIVLIRSIERHMRIYSRESLSQMKITNGVLNDIFLNYNFFPHSLTANIDDELHEFQLVRFITKRYLTLRTRDFQFYLF